MRQEYPHAIGYRVVVLPDPVEETTEAGIVLPETVTKMGKAATTKGTLLQKGPMVEHGVKEIPIGARIAYAKYAGKFVDNPEDENNPFVIMNDEDVISELKEDNHE